MLKRRDMSARVLKSPMAFKEKGNEQSAKGKAHRRNSRKAATYAKVAEKKIWDYETRFVIIVL
jgi:hypothetical protein